MANHERSTVIDFGVIGIRSRQLAVCDVGEATEAVMELEEAGFSTLWMNAEPLLERSHGFAEVTKRMVFATSVASIWMHEPEVISSAFHRFNDHFPNRLALGVGASHASIVKMTSPGRTYSKPVSSMAAWLDEMDSLARPVTDTYRIIAAIWPRMLGVARTRAMGSHPYLVPAEHSHCARRILGDTAVLAPAHCVVFERDATKAREVARAHLANPYTTLPNYTKAWLQHGFNADDLVNGCSD